MKPAHLIFGLLLLAGASRLNGASTPDVQISAPGQKESPALPDKRRGSSPDGPETDSGHRVGYDDTVVILGVTEQKPDADGRCKVTVRVSYALVHYPKGVLSLGFNLKSATKFARVADQPVMAGNEEVELVATIVPVTWPKAQPFKLSVSLSAEPRPGQWTMLAAVSHVLKPAAGPEASH